MVDLICTAFNITEDHGKELINKYARKSFEEFVAGKITNAQFISSFFSLDELTANEQCFLTAHCAMSALLAIREAEKQIKLARLIQEGLF